MGAKGMQAPFAWHMVRQVVGSTVVGPTFAARQAWQRPAAGRPPASLS